MRMNQKLCGIPLYIRPYNKEREMSLWTFISFGITSTELDSGGWQKVKVLESVAEDVPLCDFSMIKSALEEEINAGYLRKVFDLEFGYALFNDPETAHHKIGSEDRIYYAVPVWHLNCLYVENPKHELHDGSEWGVNERSGKDYYSILYNAQTAKKIDRQNTRKGSGNYQGFISWDDVGSR